MVEIEKQDVEKTKRKVILDYDKNMDGVDNSDGIIVTYSIARKRLKKYY